ncbi:hypothetical protein GCM10008942_03330 [Rhizomicrobium electricum]|jgi:hypothetical protein|uniref:Uncharacterized protein n=1 Tax=Rhizomicrobium electricum TaxID=480070 RepID=A0ABN1E3A7_9PROT|nr:hypothetical protein [Rhizomicrobium electricum]
MRSIVRYAVFAFLPGAALITPVTAAPDGNHGTPCLYTLRDAPPDAPKFSDWPVRAMTTTHRVSISLRHNPQARLFRTVLRQASQQEPDFAGHYKIAVWGCGASCTDWGIIDLATGKVVLDESLRGIGGANIGPETETPDYWGLRFRKDSALLIVVGAPREDDRRDGIAYYHWTGKAFRLLRFVNAGSICKRSTG